MIQYYASQSSLLLVFVALGLAVVIPAPVTAEPRQDYGLGLPTTAGTGGGTRYQPPNPPVIQQPSTPINSPNNGGETNDAGTTRSTKPYRLPSTSGSAGRDSLNTKPRPYNPYGLGIPALPAGSNGTICLPPQGKAPHNCLSNFPRVILLSPEDGGRSFSERPTLYWYVTDAMQSSEQPLQIKFRLFATAERDTPVVYESTMTVTKSGLYRLTLPPEISLKRDTYQRWQISWQQLDGSKPASANTAILWQNKIPYPANWNQMDLLAQARWYSQNSYWHDAVAAYTLWLSQNTANVTPQQPLTNTKITINAVRWELHRLLANGLSSQSIFSSYDVGSRRLSHLLQKLTEQGNSPTP
jgi:hypothetical protein